MKQYMQLGKVTSIVVVGIILAVQVSCRKTYTPKPKGYFRIEMPDKAYTTFDTTYPYQFDYPVYAQVVPDSAKSAEKYWVNLWFKQFNGKIHMSYKNIDNNLDALLEDSYRLAYKHSIKADAINEKLFIDEDKKVYGILYNIDGDAASSIQFFATDSTKHFLRGSLYFNARPNKDSLAPVINFVREDVIHLMESIRWK